MATPNPMPSYESAYLRERRASTRQFRTFLEDVLKRKGADDPQLAFRQYGRSRFRLLEDGQVTPVVRRRRWHLEDLLVLCYGATQGYTFAEIARVLGRTPAAVRQRASVVGVSVFGVDLSTRRDVAKLSCQNIRRVDRAMRKAGLAPRQRVLDPTQELAVHRQLLDTPRRTRRPPASS